MVSKRVPRMAQSDVIQQKKLANKGVEKAFIGTGSPLDVEPPPGLEIPPGLTLPPGLGSAKLMEEAEAPMRLDMNSQAGPGAAPGTTKVCLSGLPNSILSPEMFEAVLEQAGVEEDVAGFQTHLGENHGKATVLLFNPLAVQRCLDHFNGCEWLSGTKVNATIVEPGVALAFSKGTKEVSLRVSRLGLKQAALDSSSLQALGEPGKILTAEACRYMRVITAAGSYNSTAKEAAAKKRRGGLSADAPAFVPMAVATTNGNDRRQGKQVGRRGNSETSTEIGESEGEEREGVEV